MQLAVKCADHFLPFQILGKRIIYRSRFGTPESELLNFGRKFWWFLCQETAALVCLTRFCHTQFCTIFILQECLFQSEKQSTNQPLEKIYKTIHVVIFGRFWPKNCLLAKYFVIEFLSEADRQNAHRTENVFSPKSLITRHIILDTRLDPTW